MIILKKIILLTFIVALYSCANTGVNKNKEVNKKKYYSSFGFALIYDDNLNAQGIINKKIDNTKIITIHSSLRKNTLIKIINPDNSKAIETKIIKNGKYPKIFIIVISKKIADLLEIDENNPYIEIYETKKNKSFVAKEGDMFDEEKKVATNAPVDEIKMDDLSESKIAENKTVSKINKFVIVISDFYYLESANNLKTELIKKTSNNNFLVKKINNNKYRLSAGPFKNFNALKSTYISLNNLGFEELNIYNK